MKHRIIVLPEELDIVVDRLEKVEKALKKEQKQIDDPILGTEDVLSLLKVSRRCLQTWRDEGLIEFSAVKGKFYYRMSAINNMLAKHLQKEGGNYGKS
jgi:Helix-turn-helix domain